MTTDPHTLLAPYALDALDDAERRLFEDHLATCETCLDELAGFEETAARLGETAATTPPPALRDRVLSAASRTPQERPVVTSLSARRRARLLPRLAVAAAAVVALGSAGGLVAEHHQAQTVSASQKTLQRIVAAPDAQESSTGVPGGGTLTMTLSHQQDGAVLVARGLPDISGKTYQLWSMKNGVPTSQGTFSGGRVITVADLHGADAVAVTVEPAGGSKKPTSKAIATMPV